MSPVYISPKVQNLKNGEAINYFPGGRYSTLDHELIARLNSKKQIQDRYHPAPINNFKSKDPPNNVKENSKPASRPSDPPIGPSIGPSSSDMFDFSKPTFSESYDYKPPDYLSSKPISKPPDYLSDKPISKPMSMDDYANSEISDTPPDSNKPDSYFASHDHESSDYTDYSPDTSYNNDAAPKPIEYSGHLDHPPFDSDDDHSYDHHHHHDFHHEVIYDHIPEHHEHVEEEMNDQRLDKRPYSYYYIGKKLWYIPLYFSIYFIVYIAALVLKSIARHKITFPAHLADAVDHHARTYSDFSWWNFGEEVLRDRVQTNLVYHCFLLLVCISHASVSELAFDEIDTLSKTNEYEDASTINTALQAYRHPRMYRRGYHEDHGYQDDDDDHHDNHMKDEEHSMKAIGTAKVDYWAGYYDFLINEGSYKFWAVFQLATAALLIYSGFAALYYAKVNPPPIDDEFDILRRRKRRSLSIFPRDRSFCGLDSATFQRIIDAVAREIH
ncbi:hypothetical protein K0M31_016443 [Melipona bicolor]|uniref:Uncharacterized protein n=1 Tax=Melipona bicolor TaxID=60889 RepID=A0AA40G760_9HYME|nr:hypothetical protein K0M31_016443 [Melipona bicolor]